MVTAHQPPLPRLLLLTDRHQTDRPLLDVLRAAVDGGAEAVVLREKDLPVPQRRALAEAAAKFVPLLLVAAGRAAPSVDPHLSRGVHLAADARTPTARPVLLGRSCHTAGELRRAAAERLDYVTLSPILPTATKPGYGPPLGTRGLAALVADLPPTDADPPAVYALGGITAATAADCRAAGAHGVAVLGTVLRAADPAHAVRELRRALGETG